MVGRAALQAWQKEEVELYRVHCGHVQEEEEDEEGIFSRDERTHAVSVYVRWWLVV